MNATAIETKANGEVIEPKAKAPRKRAPKNRIADAKKAPRKRTGGKSKAKAAPKQQPAKAAKVEPSGIAKMTLQHQVALYTLGRLGREVTYKELEEHTGMSRAVLRRVVNSQTDQASLIAQKLVTAKQYEVQDGEFSSPFHFQLTEAGRKLVS